MDARFLISAHHPSQYPPPDRPEVAFAGRSNVGKSSLLNVLVNRKNLARISSTPGRTQAINFFQVDSGWYLVDLPGYGFARVPLHVKENWRKMVEAYLRNRTNLRTLVVILDVRRDPAAGDLDLLHWLNHYRISPIVVLTKADKISRQQAGNRANRIKQELKQICTAPPVLFSAKTRQGKDAIWNEIHRLCGKKDLSNS